MQSKLDRASSNLSTEESSYDVFVSYARQDNGTGWVTQIVERLRAARAASGAPPLRVFFDAAEIRGMDDWRRRLEGALRRSHILLVCLSPAWAASTYCRFEHEWFHATRKAWRMAMPDAMAVVPLRDLTSADLEPLDARERARVESLSASQHLIDLRPWFADAGGTVRPPSEWPATQGDAAWAAAVKPLLERLHRAREAQRAPGNLRPRNRAFVGRVQALHDLHRMLALGQPGVVCAVQGLGGIGKTELALQYAHEYACHHSGGLWQLGAEGHKELLPLLGRLGEDPVFRDVHGADGHPFAFTDAERIDARAQGQRVLHEMRKRAQRLRDVEDRMLSDAGAARHPHDGGGGGAVLVFLDNVDQPELLSPVQLSGWSELNQGHECIRFLATSRVGADQWQASAVEVLALERLGYNEALELMQRHREGRPWPDAAYESGVRALLELLDGYTLLVEQVALYLGRNPEVRPEDLLDEFHRRGLTVGDALHSHDELLKGAVLHRDKLFAVVLDQTLSAL